MYGSAIHGGGDCSGQWARCTDRREAQDYAVAVLFVLQLNYPKLSNDQLD